MSDAEAGSQPHSETIIFVGDSKGAVIDTA